MENQTTETMHAPSLPDGFEKCNVSACETCNSKKKEKKNGNHVHAARDHVTEKPRKRNDMRRHCEAKRKKKNNDTWPPPKKRNPARDQKPRSRSPSIWPTKRRPRKDLKDEVEAEDHCPRHHDCLPLRRASWLVSKKIQQPLPTRHDTWRSSVRDIEHQLKQECVGPILRHGSPVFFFPFFGGWGPGA